MAAGSLIQLALNLKYFQWDKTKMWGGFDVRCPYYFRTRNEGMAVSGRWAIKSGGSLAPKQMEME